MVKKGYKEVSPAVIVNNKIYKPCHVDSVVDLPGCDKLKFKQATKLDLCVAKLPSEHAHHAAKIGVFEEGEAYKWKDKALIHLGGQLITDVGGSSKSGLSVNNNKGEVMGIVTEGRLVDENRHLAAIVFSKKYDPRVITSDTYDKL